MLEALRSSGPPLRLHLGCGRKRLAGFFHIDALPFDHIDRVGPVEDLSFLPEGSVELIYACHVLEHFGRHVYLDVLREWCRVLQPGGVLRVAVPDFAKCAELYVAGKLPNGLADITGLVVGGQKDVYDYHKIVFDEPTLSEALRQAGFSEVRHWDWREMLRNGLDDYSQAFHPHMDKENGELMSLNLEAIR